MDGHARRVLVLAHTGRQSAVRAAEELVTLLTQEGMRALLPPTEATVASLTTAETAKAALPTRRPTLHRLAIAHSRVTKPSPTSASST